MYRKLVTILLFTGTLLSCSREELVYVSGELKTWHRVTLEITGPQLHEQSLPNPFLHYRLEVTFTNGEHVYSVPGFFAADGMAAETGATIGSIWKVHFCPDKPGKWDYSISFKRGDNLSLSEDPEEGEPVVPDGFSGSFMVEETDKTGRDFRHTGRLVHDGGHYLRYAGTGEYFIKGGADSPENFLAFRDFDGTYYGGNNRARSGEDSPNAGLHAYQAHVKDWKEGDPVWKGNKGKGIIGALNYLAGKGMNSVYFLTLNILGDGEDVWPYTDRNERYRFDCSKLDQWEVVFSHMDSLGIMLHVVLQETENECLLDAGYLDVQRKLYLRELVARFSHHPAITWNLGEEHGPVEWSPYGQTVGDTKKMADYLRMIDPYDHPIVVHTHSYEPVRHVYISRFLGHESIDGPSIQVGKPENTMEQTLKWLGLSEDSAHSWVVCLDEIGPASTGAKPDAVDPDHDLIRQQVLWANLMAGGAGVEWYFGYEYDHGDLSCEDWRSRDRLWDQTRYALEFFNENLPFAEMKNMNQLVRDGYCFAAPANVYAAYFPGNSKYNIDLRDTEGEFEVWWYNPRLGGELARGETMKISGGKVVDVGLPPGETGVDWVCLIRR